MYFSTNVPYSTSYYSADMLYSTNMYYFAIDATPQYCFRTPKRSHLRLQAILTDRCLYPEVYVTNKLQPSQLIIIQILSMINDVFVGSV